ncbi:hypothetical protein AB7W88_03210 [Providencia vermicola]|uniref:Uncharacterized protein n=2 Tax=Morganellaceae TaxID=1903414 RepID=A0AAI9MST3_MORMO|nr:MULTISPECIES: hypothetical protein [Providencia]EJV1663857.1 hypothetical protein [Klebsiella pneumoniae]EKW8761644.1 hypothetical protein [Morganella morganii]HEJ9425111.1 hypothetical protein [Proteus mirabilis]ELI9034815.1 hypothetical protein [Morganella morganii]MBX6949209.1 hypothetical protein [Providencia rettgeri]
MSVTDSLVKQFFDTWFLSTERKKRNDDTWRPPVEGQDDPTLYHVRRDAAYEAWFARSDYPLLSAKAMTMHDEMYRYLHNVRKAREAEINKERPPAVLRDLGVSSLRDLADYLIRNDIAGRLV